MSREKVISAMLGMSLTCLERGMVAQSLYEAGETERFVAYAYTAVADACADGRLANAGFLVSEPAASGCAVWRAYEHTKDDYFRQGVDNMMAYLMMYAPRTTDGVIFHYSPDRPVDCFTHKQIWAQDCYSSPPFLALMNELTEATKMFAGFYNILVDESTGLLFEGYDMGSNTFVSRRLSAKGNALALLGAAEIINEAAVQNEIEVAKDLSVAATEFLNNILKFQRDDGLFHGVLNNKKTKPDTAAGLIVSSVIHRGIYEGWLDENLKERADRATKTAQTQINEYGFIQDKNAITAITQSAYVINDVWENRN